MPAYKDTKRKTWYVKYAYKDELENKYRHVTKRGFKTKKDALAWETENIAKSKGFLNMKFSVFCDLYMEHQFVKLKPGTYATKKSIIEHHIIPYLGDIKVNEITVRHVMEWQNRIMSTTNNGKKFSKSYLKTIHSQLSAILNFAVKYYDLPKNPAEIVGNMGTDKDVVVHFWTEKQYLQFRNCMMEEPTYYYAFECLYWLGIREGEMMALTPADIDFEKKEVSITKTYYQLQGQEYIGTPKTHKSIRVVSMPDFLCGELKDYIDFILEGCGENERLFSFSKSMISRALARGAEKADLPKIRIHDLRHSHCSLLIEMGYSAVAIAERLGHESVHITYKYAHMFPSVQRDMAQELNNLGMQSEMEREE